MVEKYRPANTATTREIFVVGVETFWYCTPIRILSPPLRNIGPRLWYKTDVSVLYVTKFYWYLKPTINRDLFSSLKPSWGYWVTQYRDHSTSSSSALTSETHEARETQVLSQHAPIPFSSRLLVFTHSHLVFSRSSLYCLPSFSLVFHLTFFHQICSPVFFWAFSLL